MLKVKCLTIEHFIKIGMRNKYAWKDWENDRSRELYQVARREAK